MATFVLITFCTVFVVVVGCILFKLHRQAKDQALSTAIALKRSELMWITASSLAKDGGATSEDVRYARKVLGELTKLREERSRQCHEPGSAAALCGLSKGGVNRMPTEADVTPPPPPPQRRR